MHFQVSIPAIRIINKQGRQCTYKRNIEKRSHNNCCRRKAINITCYGCVSVALVSQHPMNMRPGILSLGFQALRYFSTLSNKRKDFLKTLLNIKCVF
jgi:hypothetical protein